MKAGLRVFFAILFAVSCTAKELHKTELILSFTPKMFNDAATFFLPIFFQNFPQGKDIAPLINKSAITEFIVHKLSAEVDNKFANFNPENNEVTLILKSVQAKISVSGYVLLFPFSLNLDVTSPIITIKLKLNSDSQTGRPSLVVTVIDMGDLSLGNGILESILTFIVNLLRGEVTDLIKNSINGAVAKALNVQTMTPLLFLDVALDLRMLDKPEVTSASGVPVLALYFSGSFMRYSTLESLHGLIPTDHINAKPTSHMIGLNFGTHIANSLMHVLRENEVLQFEVTALDLPESTRQFLNTKFYRFLIRPLFDTYRNSYLSLVINTPHPPTLSLVDKKGMYLNTAIDIRFDVIDQSGAEPIIIPTIKIQVNARALIRVDVQKNEANNDTIFIAIDYDGFDLELIEHKSIEEFDISFLRATIDSFFTFGAATVNALLRKGIEIPSFKGFTIEDPSVVFTSQDAFVVLNLSFPFRTTDPVNFTYWNELIGPFINGMLDPKPDKDKEKTEGRRSVSEELNNLVVEPLTKQLTDALETTKALCQTKLSDMLSFGIKSKKSS